MSNEQCVPPILIVIHTNSYFSNLYPLIRLLKMTQQFSPVVAFANYYPTLPNDYERCRQEHIQVVILSDVSFPKTRYETEEGFFINCYALIKKNVTRVKSFLFNRIIQKIFLYHIWILSRRMRLIKQVIQEGKIELLIVPADNRYDISAIIRAAKQQKVRTVVVPSFMAGALEWAEYVWKLPHHQCQTWQNQLIGWAFPRWTMWHNGKKIIAQPAAEVIALELMKIAPPKPWILHSGFSDVIALESQAVKRYCLTEGISETQLTVTGSVAHDVLADGLLNAEVKKASLYKSLGLPDYPMILCALPPNSHYMGGGRAEYEFATYSQLVEYWIKSLVAISQCNVIVVLHPSVVYEQMAYIEAWGCKIVRTPTIEVVPLCDIYVASVSATIQWAIACGKPVLNYDVYQYHYTDYIDAPRVINVFNKNGFQTSLKQVVARITQSRKIRSSIDEDSEFWGLLDGKAGNRLMSLFESLIEKQK